MPAYSDTIINNKLGNHAHIQLDAKTLRQLVEISESFYQETDLERISEILLNTIRQILQVDTVALFVFVPEKGKYINFIKSGDLILEPSSRLFREIIRDVERHPIIINSAGKYRFPAKFCSGIIFPLNRYVNQHFLWVERSSDIARPLETKDLDVLTIIIHQGIVAMENILLTHQLNGIPIRSYWGANTMMEFLGPTQKPAPTANLILEKKPADYLLKSRQAKILIGNDICFDPDHRTLGCEDTKVNLTPAETKLLGALFQENYQVVTHEDLIYLMQGYKTDREDAARILRPLVCRLKKKFDQFSGGNRWIQNIRGNGYRLEIPVETGKRTKIARGHRQD